MRKNQLLKLMNKHKTLRNARRSAKMAQHSLAEAAGIDQSQISRMESGEMWAANDTLTRIADILGIPVVSLLDIDGLTVERAEDPHDSAPAIKKNRRLPKGLRDLASDKLSQALKIKSPEWTALASFQAPSPIDRDGYVALLTTLSSVTQS